MKESSLHKKQTFNKIKYQRKHHDHVKPIAIVYYLPQIAPFNPISNLIHVWQTSNKTANIMEPTDFGISQISLLSESHEVRQVFCRLPLESKLSYHLFTDPAYSLTILFKFLAQYLYFVRSLTKRFLPCCLFNHCPSSSIISHRW